MPTPTLLLTRPEADARRFLASMGDWPAVISPVMRIEPVDHDAARLHDAPGLVFTSGHAVAAAGPGRGRPAICVGGRTAEVARAAGFDVTEGEGRAESLMPLIRAADVALIHPHGRHVARRLPVPGVVVYDQVAQPLNDAAHALLAGDGAVILPVFSPRSADLLSQAVAGARAPLWVIALSDAVQNAFRARAARVETACHPTGQAMRRAILRMAGTEQS
ncbi:uroporphyrinogen-III synthase [Paracoccus sp. 1_MG-2023]|uniref:uroporphyrinogen-III synthase n=1 Tax=unclassified Paracoccus (in: a-proteobacteria) TaxID=2688777 RepID=UPI00209030C4|nr:MULTISPECIES: uroporphyrinogen-III synthase [unclassified Paracoccus (in: a-proteobacteria)]MDO6669544.1 uroporphyrinogen-III synthase [Paracoccus sp. 1_MG-2023]